MKAFILTEGGKNIGFGHIARCISLSDAFEKKNIRPEFIINGDNSIAGILKGKKYRILNWVKEKDILLRLIKASDIVFIDSYLAGASLYKDIAGLVKKAVYMDDNARLDYPEGIVVNGALYAKRLRYRRKSGSEYLLGIKYFPLRKAYRRFSKKEIRRRVKNIMVTFGGDDKQNLTPKILDFLNEEYPAMQKYVIIGKGFHGPNVRRIKGLKRENTRLMYNPDSKSMKRAMLDADITISAGGQTLYELAKLGVPTIGICVARNQLRNLEAWHRRGFLRFIGWHYRKDLPLRLRDAIRLLMPYPERKRRERIGAESIDGRGVERIADFLAGNIIRKKGK